MLVVTETPRIFNFVNKGKTIPLVDIDPAMSSQAVLNFYANTYPELVNAKVTGPTFVDGDKLEYKFETVMGTKG